jgi:hypothetical protein
MEAFYDRRALLVHRFADVGLGRFYWNPIDRGAGSLGLDTKPRHLNDPVFAEFDLPNAQLGARTPRGRAPIGLAFLVPITVDNSIKAEALNSDVPTRIGVNQRISFGHQDPILALDVPGQTGALRRCQTQRTIARS